MTRADIRSSGPEPDSIHELSHQELVAQLRHAQKLEVLGRLAGGVAHDFNNLLTVILGHTDMLLVNTSGEPAVREGVEEIRKAAESASSLTRQLLNLSRKQAPAPRLIDLNAAVRQMERLLRRLLGTEVALVTGLAEPAGMVRVDPGHLEQVLLNLAVNGRDAMPRGGTLTIRTGIAKVPDGANGDHGAGRAGAYASLAVSDTGSGMSPETLAHLFEPFFTTKDAGKGTGLGLAIVHGIVGQQGGQITVESEVGRGTTITVLLPLAEGAECRPASPALAPETVPGNGTVLVIESQESVRGTIRQTLAAEGYQVLEAKSGGEAARTCALHDGPIRLMITDVLMPGISGRELAEMLGATRPTMRVLYLSGHHDDPLLRRGAIRAGSAWLAKPFTPESLAAKVREVMER